MAPTTRRRSWVIDPPPDHGGRLPTCWPGVERNSLGLSTETFDSRGRFDPQRRASIAALRRRFRHTAAGVVNGSSSVTAAPFVGPLPGHQDTTNYLSVGGGGTETITFGSEQNAFGLYWGSVDSYNTIRFYDGTTARRFLYRRQMSHRCSPIGNQGSFASNGYVQFSGLRPVQQGRPAVDLERIRDRQYFFRRHSQPSSPRRSRERSASTTPISAIR